MCGSLDGSYHLQCIPVACQVLSDCCAFVETEEAVGVSGSDGPACRAALATTDAAICDAELAAIRAEGHCGEPCTAANQCANGVCASGACTGGGGSTSSSSSGGAPEACDGSWCNGCTGGGGAYCCSACTTSIMCESQCTGTDDF